LEHTVVGLLAVVSLVLLGISAAAGGLEEVFKWGSDQTCVLWDVVVVVHSATLLLVAVVEEVDAIASLAG
jgi:hypothetical protein